MWRNLSTFDGGNFTLAYQTWRCSIPIPLRGIRKISADFITRADDREIQRWPNAKGLAQIQMTSRRADCLRSIPKIARITDRVENPQYSLSTVCDALSVHFDEWNDIAGVGSLFWSDDGIWPLTIDCPAVSFRPILPDAGIRPWSARAKQEMRIFAKRAHRCQPERCFFIDPSELAEDIADVAMNWSQTWWLGSNGFGGFLRGAWPIHVRS